MNFAKFIFESTHKKELSREDAIKLIKEHCDTEKVLYRGMSGDDYFYKIKGEDGQRVSANTSNHYTIILDKLIAEKDSKYPLRSRSIICTDNKADATQFNENTYVILPFKNVVFGKVNAADLWAKRVKLGGINLPIEYWNDMFNDAGISSVSYDKLIDDLEKLLEADKVEDKDYTEDDLSYSDAIEYLYLAFDFDAKNVRPYIEKAYSPDTLGFEFVTIETNRFKRTSSEYWISGDCVAVIYDIWKNLKTELDKE